MTTREEEAGGLDPLAELDAIVELGRRAPGSDAERRTAVHLAQRLAALGRSAETESLAIHPGWPLAYAILASASVGASVLAVYVPVAGAALALGAALLTFLDAGMLLPTARRLLGRRASQNVVSWGGADKPGALVLVAHYDAARAGLAHTDRTARRKAALSRLIRRPIGGLQPLFWAELGVLACALLRLVGVDGTALTAVQFVPTLVLLAAVALLTDLALAGTRAGENDNASGSGAGPAPGRASRRRPRLLRRARPLQRRAEGRRRGNAGVLRSATSSRATAPSSLTSTRSAPARSATPVARALC